MEALGRIVKPFKKDYELSTLHSPSDSDDLSFRSEERHLMSGHLTTKPVSKISNACVFLTITNLVILGMTSTLVFTSHCKRFPARNEALRATSWWSPILDSIDIPNYETTLNGTFFPKPEVSIAREEPSPENDAAWEKFEEIRSHVVSREDIIRLGKDPDTVARFDDEYWGLGNDAYMVQLDVMHQIHCLNMLRKAAFRDYPGYAPATPPGMEHDEQGATRWIHLGHCVDMILQNIQCNANTEVLTLAWVEDREKPWPDFSVKRKCRNFDTIVQWQIDNEVDEEKFDNMPVPKDAFRWPAPWKTRESELGEELGQHHKQEGGMLLSEGLAMDSGIP